MIIVISIIYSVFRRNGHNFDPCNSCLKAYFVLFLSCVSIYGSGARQKSPLDMFKCYLRCHQGPSLQQMILSRSVGPLIISDNTEISWPARRPDKAPCDFYLWGICEAEIRRVKPKTLEDLMEVVNKFVASLDETEVRRDVRAVRSVRPRAELCIKIGGSPSFRNTRGAPLRSSNISTAWSYEPIATFGMIEN